MSYLNSHPNILTHGEVFGRLKARSATNLLQNVHGKYPRMVRAAGFKLFYYHPLDRPAPELWQTLKDDKTVHVIHLVRRDLARTLISRAIAQETDVWVQRAGEQRPASPSTEPPRITVDLDWYREQMAKTCRWQQETRESFSQHPFLEIAYEDLVAKLPETFATITSHLGVTPMVPTTKQRKQNPGDLSPIVINFDEVQEATRAFEKSLMASGN